jgi:hypothetical protein
VLSSFGTREFLTKQALVGNVKRLLETTTLIGNDKCLLETTKPCRKPQTLDGNDKALSANLSLAEEKTHRRISLLPYMPCRNKNDKHMLLLMET